MYIYVLKGGTRCRAFISVDSGSSFVIKIGTQIVGKPRGKISKDLEITIILVDRSLT